MKSHNFNLLFCLFFGLLILGCEKEEENGPGSGSETKITQAEYAATLGDMTVYHVDVHAADLDPGPSGENVSWDFSKYETPSAITSQESFQCPGEEACSEFPDANRMVSWNEAGGGSYDYTILSEKEHTRIGAKSVDEGILTTYDDPEIIWKFPMEYQQHFSQYDKNQNHPKPGPYQSCRRA